MIIITIVLVMLDLYHYHITGLRIRKVLFNISRSFRIAFLIMLLLIGLHVHICTKCFISKKYLVNNIFLVSFVYENSNIKMLGL
jgi:hypothetical protein